MGNDRVRNHISVDDNMISIKAMPMYGTSYWEADAQIGTSAESHRLLLCWSRVAAPLKT